MTCRNENFINSTDELTGENLRRTRKSLGISQEAIAYEIGVEQSYVSKLELGRIYNKAKIKALLLALSKFGKN